MQRTSDARLRAWEAFLRAHAAVLPLLAGELERAQRIPLHYYDVLVQLSGVKAQRLRLKDLNQCVVLSQSAFSRLIDRMEADGLVSRSPDPNDRRGTIVSMTRQGLSALRRAAPVHMAGIQRHFASHLSDDEARMVAEVMERVRAAATPPSPA